MKKYIIRLIGALCILAAMLVAVFPTWVEIDGVKGKEIRTFSKQMSSELERVEEWLVVNIHNDDVKEDLKDNDLPYKERTIKNRIRETEDLLDELIDDELSLNEIITVAAEAPKYITDTENLLDTSDVGEHLLTKVTKYTSYDTVEEIIEGAAPFKVIAYLVLGFFGIVGLLGVAAAVCHMLNKVRFIKYIFLPFFLLIAIGVLVGIPMLSDLIQSELYLPESAEDLGLQTTVMPYIAIALALVPVVLDIIFERKQKIKTEA